MSLLLEELGVAHADGSFRKRLAQLAKVDLLILDDFGMHAMTQESKTDLLEVIEGRMEGRSTLITSQVPVEEWHDYLSEGNSYSGASSCGSSSRLQRFEGRSFEVGGEKAKEVGGLWLEAGGGLRKEV